MMKRMMAAGIVLLTTTGIAAQNPVVQTCYTGDPAPMVSGDRMYIYTGHDEDGADFFWMNEWRVYSSSDMVNWTDHGSPLDLSSFTWADGRAWAAQCIERDGKFYWYVCAHSKLTGAMAIGVAVGDTPTGPFRDAIGRPLADGNWAYIDPTVMIDDDGQAWLFWGNPDIYYVKLNRDMVSYDGEIQVVEQTVEGFGAPDIKEREQHKDTKYKDCYTEGPWLMSRRQGDKVTRRQGSETLSPTNHESLVTSSPMYYLLYAAGGVPEHIAYSTAASPTGPWTYRGEIMPLEDTGSFTNHCGVADFKGHSYFVYHTGKLPGGGGFGRSVAIEEFRYNADGTFPIIHHTAEGVSPIGTLNPYQRTEAETIAWAHGVKTESHYRTGVYVSDTHDGDHIRVRCVEFGDRAPKSFTASVASALQGGTIEVRTDSLQGQQIATLVCPKTGGWNEWTEVRSDVTEAVTGTHDLYFLFRGNYGAKLMNFDWWRFEE